jgi:hypothetical protein
VGGRVRGKFFVLRELLARILSRFLLNVIQTSGPPKRWALTCNRDVIRPELMRKIEVIDNIRGRSAVTAPNNIL